MASSARRPSRPPRGDPALGRDRPRGDIKERREAMMGPSDRLRAIWRNSRIAAEQMKAQLPFRQRGLSDRTIQALVDCSIDSPERLLFMTEKEIQLIPGVGKVSMAEIVAYRVKFIR